MKCTEEVWYNRSQSCWADCFKD